MKKERRKEGKTQTVRFVPTNLFSIQECPDRAKRGVRGRGRESAREGVWNHGAFSKPYDSTLFGAFFFRPEVNRSEHSC